MSYSYKSHNKSHDIYIYKSCVIVICKCYCIFSMVSYKKERVPVVGLVREEEAAVWIAARVIVMRSAHVWKITARAPDIYGYSLHLCMSKRIYVKSREQFFSLYRSESIEHFILFYRVMCLDKYRPVCEHNSLYEGRHNSRHAAGVIQE